MVESPAEIALDRISQAIVPEGVLARLFAVQPEHIGKAPVHNLSQRLVNKRMIADVPQQLFGVINIHWLRRDIKIAHPQNRLARFEVLVKETVQSVEPFELVLEFFRLGHISLWDVCVDDGDASNYGLYQPGLVFRLIIETTSNIGNSALSEDCDAVISLLAPEHTIVSDLLKGFGWEISVLYFCLLEAKNIRAVALQPFEDYGQPSTN